MISIINILSYFIYRYQATYKNRPMSLYFVITSIRYAGDICVGDEALIDGNDELMPSTVVNVSILSMQGRILENYVLIHIIKLI